MKTYRGAAILVVAALALVSGCSASKTVSGSETTPRGSQPSTPVDSVTSEPLAPGNGIHTRSATVPLGDPTTRLPTRLTIPKARVDVAVQPVGVAADGQMALPPDPSVIGWYRFGPGPGDHQGTVVLGGHVDSTQYGVGPLVRLRRVNVGDLVSVRSGDGSTAQYRVKSVDEIAKKRLPIAQLFDRNGPPTLRIVTCAGPYDRDRGGYRDNLVVTASPV